MCSKTKTTSYTSVSLADPAQKGAGECAGAASAPIISAPISRECAQLRDALAAADAVVIGAGAGLSTSAGYLYAGERFRTHFHDFEEKYGFHDMYSGGFHHFDCPEEEWGFWCRFIHINRYVGPAKPVYQDLYHLVKEKDYFVITTNVDHMFQRSGFAKERLFYTQGDYGLFQCAKPCHEATYDNEAVVRAMLAAQEGMRVPTALIPRCPHCGAQMSMNLRADATFVEDAGWHKAAQRYQSFLAEHQNNCVLFLELGTGYNTPSIIKYNFWRYTNEWENATYACINLEDADVPHQIAKKSISIEDDIGNVLKLL